MVKDKLLVNGSEYVYFSINKAAGDNIDTDKIPKSIKVLIENTLRNGCEKDAKVLLDWKNGSSHEIAYMPSQVLMQDFTGVPAIVDLASMRDAQKMRNKNPEKINPEVPVNLVIDHSIQVDKFGNGQAFEKNIELEMQRNHERYKFLKWGQNVFDNFLVVPPGTGICHQVNLEYLVNVVSTKKLEDGSLVAYPDTIVGTDSHTTMINALSVLGWGVGGIEAEAVMLGQPVSMLIPEVVGVELYGSLREGVTATDLVLTITQILREKKVVQKFVEFYGDGLSNLSLADRATISNMSPEYGATCGFFPIDEKSLDYLYMTGRSKDLINLVENYMRAQGLFYESGNDAEYTDVVRLDLASIEPCLAGPKRPQDRILLSDMPNSIAGAEYSDTALHNGAVVIAAITSCTNTSNPSVMIAAGLLAKNTCEVGLKVKDWVKTSLAPGSQVVTQYLNKAGLQIYLDKLGFNLIGYGCTTCIGNSGPLPDEINDKIAANDLHVASVLSGNRNFEGRIHNRVKSNFLASPPLVIAYALMGSVARNLNTDPIGKDASGKDVYLKDIWPSNKDIEEVMKSCITRDMFIEKYTNVTKGDKNWQSLQCEDDLTYNWDENSSYIRCAPYFTMDNTPKDINGARMIALLGDSITTDHISPAGVIATDSPAAKYLKDRGFASKDFNSYGSRRGNHEVMMRGTFSNVRIKNLIVPNTEGGVTKYFPSDEVMSIYDASLLYMKQNVPLIVVAGKEYGTGSSRDWAAKGSLLLGVKAVIAVSFERIHRSNLVGMGVLPLVFSNPDDSKFKGDEIVSIVGIGNIKPQSEVQCKVSNPNGSNERVISLKCAIYTNNELQYFKKGGILKYVLDNK